MKPPIILTKKVVEEITFHGKTTFPNECCGFLYGKESEKGRLIDQIVPVNNAKEGDQRRRFEIHPKAYIKAELFAIQQDKQLLGIYHSHPNHPAIASKTDLDQALPYFSYVIISIVNGEYNDLKSWRLLDNQRIFDEEKVIISGHAQTPRGIFAKNLF